MSQGTPRILIVDDEPTTLRLLVEALRREGFRTMTADSGPDGLRGARDGSPDLILLDIRMPDMDGFEVCRRLKEDPGTRMIPVIFLTAMDDVGYKEEGFLLGGVDYLTKPVSVRELTARVAAHLKRHWHCQSVQDRLIQYEQRYGPETLPTAPPFADDRLRRAELVSAYLLDHLDHTPSLAELARMAATNRATLNAHFRLLYGLSVFDWLQEQRMQRAALLLRTTRQSIQTIALAVGYGAGANFSTAFKRRFGISPTRYRIRPH